MKNMYKDTKQEIFFLENAKILIFCNVKLASSGGFR